MAMWEIGKGKRKKKDKSKQDFAERACIAYIPPKGFSRNSVVLSCTTSDRISVTFGARLICVSRRFDFIDMHNKSS